METKPETHALWKLAVAFGASCTTGMDAGITHVITNTIGTEKVKPRAWDQKLQLQSSPCCLHALGSVSQLAVSSRYLPSRSAYLLGREVRKGVTLSIAVHTLGAVWQKAIQVSC